jgi:lysophospholipase L1-like esterase
MNVTKFKASLRRFSAHTLVILIASAFTVGIVELVGRFVLKYSGESTNSETRPYEPYFVSGDFYGLVTTNTLLKSQEGPAAYGYQRQYGLYFNHARDGTWNAHWRSDFLFDHYLSRYSAQDVDTIMAGDPDAVHILVIGGSAAQGSSASSKNTVWHAQLERLLRQEFLRDNIYVFNAAMGAFVSTQERIAFDLAAAPRKPDIVVILNGFNDIHLPLELAVAPGDPVQLGKRYAQVYDNSLGRFVAAHSAVFRYFQKKMVSGYLAEYKRKVLNDRNWSTNLAGGIVRTYTENMKYLLGRGKQMNAHVLLFFQPWKALSSYRVQGGDQMPEFAFQLTCYEGIKSSLKMAEESGDFVDLTDVFSTDEGLSFYTDVVHVDDRGQEILAGTIAKVLIPQVQRIFGEKTPKDG